MSLAKSKNDFSKRDMNFFSEFSSGASQNFSSAFPVFLLIALTIIIGTLIVWIACSVSTMKKTNRINDLKAEMASAEYLEKLSRKDKSQAEVEELREYYYVISSLDSRISSTTTASADTFTAVVEAVPNDTVLTFYLDQDGTVEIHGSSINRESPLNYLKTLSDKNIFSFIEESIVPYDPIEGGMNDKTLIFGEMHYDFIFKCTLKGHYAVTWAKFIDGPSLTPLGQLASQSFNAGQEYNIENIASYTESGITYDLTNIKINGVPVSASVLAEAKSTNKLNGKVATTMNIEFIYTAPKTSEGGAS